MPKKNRNIGLVAEVTLPVLNESLKDLRMGNYFLLLVLGGFSLFFMFIFNVAFIRIAGVLISGIFYVLFLGFCNIYILKISVTKFNNKLIKFNLFRYGLSWLVAIVLEFALHPLYLLVLGLPINNYDFNIKIVYVFIANGLLMGGLFFLMHDYIVIRNQKRETALENSKLLIKAEEAKNLLLKKQIHPHFFFNSLNTLKALYKKDSVLGETYLIHLADFMRTSVSNHTSQAAKLKEELELCENYLKMQEIRFGQAFIADVVINNTEKLQWFLPFFSLQPLLENAIKHNVATKENPLKIVIRQIDNIVTVTNNCNPKKYKEISTQSGLNNLCERYKIWSNDEVMIYEKNEQFIVECKLYPYENPYHRR
ncbi:sensor histidine kinase [Neptunitalea lumnitzerae]|uniref:Signal transduction histidine kinase internal region domain-containing protein n=1 Tax=Neptunitalea lumnitzerae TaxID=2965509 RepID=A0ABQ5MJM3_9FLAO|nr:histidine kinase [Neptunitalea sp. Y10]GLB49585.1 hypothetical protein Y10_19530 [Neptunitalea sp. Y10]